jgi:hypothetical protein
VNDIMVVVVVVECTNQELCLSLVSLVVVQRVLIVMVLRTFCACVVVVVVVVVCEISRAHTSPVEGWVLLRIYRKTLSRERERERERNRNPKVEGRN